MLYDAGAACARRPLIVHYAQILFVCALASLAIYLVLDWLAGPGVDRYLLLVGSVLWGLVMLAVALARARRRH